MGGRAASDSALSLPSPPSKFQANAVPTPGRVSAVRGGEGGRGLASFLSPPPPLDRIIIFKALYLRRHSAPIKNQPGLHFQQPRSARFLERPQAFLGKHPLPSQPLPASQSPSVVPTASHTEKRHQRVRPGGPSGHVQVRSPRRTWPPFHVLTTNPTPGAGWGGGVPASCQRHTCTLSLSSSPWPRPSSCATVISKLKPASLDL